MGLRCSLLGHDFGDPEVEREREERGSEVVLTVREVAECSRCGTGNVVSENKEVTTLHDAGERDSPEREAEIDDANVADEVEEPSVDADAASDSADSEASTDDDDAVIIEDDEDEDADGRAHGEWPEADEPDGEADESDDAPAEWPSIDSDDEGFDARPSAGGDAAVEFGGGLAPERATVEEEEGLEYVESAEPAGGGPADAPAESVESDDGFTRAGAAPSPAEPDTADVDAEFVCPQCGFVDDVVGSSLRAGDVCPDCRKGYLTEQGR